MDILGLTTTQAVRAVLGVSEDSLELEDVVFTAHEVEVELLLSVDVMLQPASTTYLTILASGDSSTLLPLRQWSKYFCALSMLPSLATATASKQSDGQNEFQRQTRDFEALRKDLVAQLAKYEDMLLDLLGVADTAAFSIMGISSPTFDPVTG